MAHEYVKISELEPTSSFGTADQFVIVQNEETVKIDGAALIESLATLTNLATRSYVDAVVDSAPGTLDTLRELASALNDDANFGANITALINEKLPTSNFGLEFWNQLATVNTFHISEGSNLYWTQDRFDTALSSKNTYHLAEGSNLYFTEQRVLDVVMPLIPTSFVTSYNDLTDKPTLFSGSYSDLINKPAIPTDINQLSDTNGLLGQGGGSYPTAPTFTSVTATQLNVKNVAFIGTGAVTITSGNDLNFTAAGDITFNGKQLVTSYNDLTDKPTLLKGDTGAQGPKGDTGAQGPKGDTGDVGPAGTTDYNALANKPVLATVATTGSYSDLTNTPYLPSRKTLPPTLSIGSPGDKQGDWAVDESYLYYCHSDYTAELTTISFINGQKPSSQGSSLLGKESSVTEEDFQSWIRMLNPTVGQWKFSFPTVTGATIQNIPVQVVTLYRANGNNNDRRIAIQFDGNLVNNLPGYNYQLLWNKECTLTGRASIWRRISLYGSNW